jgi:hypothetical protein
MIIAKTMTFDITDICPSVRNVYGNADEVWINGQSGFSVDLEVQALSALIEALTEAKRLMTAGAPSVPSAPAPARGIEDCDGDIWTLAPDGRRYTSPYEKTDVRTIQQIERSYGPVTELRD